MNPDPLASVRDPLRLLALRTTGILDTPAEEAFDRFGRAASRLLGAPVALVSLVDEDRQFFKSCLGLPEPWATWRETPLSHSYCQHVAATGAPLAIEDARKHPLTAGSPAIRDLGAVAYLGVPLTLEGQTLGSFCVLDRTPRRWTEEEAETLAALGAGVLREIGARAAAEQARRNASLGYYQALVERAADLVAVVEPDGAIRYVSPAAERLLGYAGAELAGRSLFDLLHPEDADLVRGEFRGAQDRPDYLARATVRFRHRDGSWRLLEGVGRNAMDEPHVAGVVFNCRDVTEARARDEALRRATSQLERILSVVPAMLYRLRVEDRSPLWVGGNVAQLLGYPAEEVLATPTWWADGVHPEDREQAMLRQEELASSGVLAHTYRFRSAGGDYRWIRDELAVVRDAEGRPGEIVGVWVDVTGQKLLEDSLRQSERLSALGRLAAGVAHELRNPLAVIAGRLEILTRQLERGEPPDAERLGRSLASLREAGERMRDIVEGLSLYSKPPKREPQSLDLRQLFEAAREVLAHLARKSGIEVHVDVPPDVPPVLADRSQLMQVLVNLATNAIEAMAPSRGGRLTLRARGRGPGGPVDAQVADSGPGISAETLARIWEPFYTTKDEGTGLGLAIVRSLVAEQPGGAIEVASRAGEGTTFTLTLSVPPSPDRAGGG